MPPVPVPSSPPSTWYPDNDLPSSSGAFTPVNLPTGWVIHPISSMIAMRPITVAASALERFYKDIISLCAQNFWSSTPDAPMLNANLQLGMLLLTIAGDPKSPGLPWGILALLAQGMLERAQRGWTSTWDGILISPTETGYRIILSVADDEPNLECDEGPKEDSDDEVVGSSSGCKKRKPS